MGLTCEVRSPFFAFISLLFICLLIILSIYFVAYRKIKNVLTEVLARVLARFLARVLAPARILALMLVYLAEMTSKCDTNSKDEIDFLTVKVWNPPHMSTV